MTMKQSSGQEQKLASNPIDLLERWKKHNFELAVQALGDIDGDYEGAREKVEASTEFFIKAMSYRKWYDWKYHKGKIVY